MNNFQAGRIDRHLFIYSHLLILLRVTHKTQAPCTLVHAVPTLTVYHIYLLSVRFSVCIRCAQSRLTQWSAIPRLYPLAAIRRSQVRFCTTSISRLMLLESSKGCQIISPVFHHSLRPALP